MYLSRPNLLVEGLASGDNKRGALCGVHVTEEGATIATDGKKFIVVEPVDANRVKGMPDVGPMVQLETGVTLPRDVVVQALKNMPKKSVMQYCMMTERQVEDGKFELTTVDLNKEQRVAGRPFFEKYPNWKQVLRGAIGKADKGRICVNRQALIELLKVMDTACPDPGGVNPVFIEFGDSEDQVIFRSFNYQTNQQVLGMLSPANTHGKWLELGKWLKKVVKNKKPARRRKLT